jgi:adenosylmethionine-8-amino-7-oxononanoate aminotransferase
MASDLPALLHPFARPAMAAADVVTIVRGDGAAVWDNHGQRYVDALASLWYCQAGHGRREIAEAVGRQANTLAGYHIFDRFGNEPSDNLALRLAAMAPMEDARVFLTSGGSESVETALKLARLAHVLAGDPERTLILSRRPSYHGVAYGASTATGLPANQAGFGPLVPDIEQVPYDDLDAIDEVIARRGHQLAAIIAEPVVGAGGVLPPPEGYLQGLRRRCDVTGAYLILDEVICGFGRLGHWWGAERYGVRPDMVTFAKGVTSGYQPLGGVLLGPAVRRPLEADAGYVLRHGFTYSGHPTACAAALANLDVLKADDLPGRALRVGERLATGLAGMVDGETVLLTRGEGAVRAMVLGDGIDATAVRDDLLGRGVIARPLGTNVIAFCPPLVIDNEDLDHVVEATAESVAAVAHQLRAPVR